MTIRSRTFKLSKRDIDQIRSNASLRHVYSMYSATDQLVPYHFIFNNCLLSYLRLMNQGIPNNVKSIEYPDMPGLVWDSIYSYSILSYYPGGRICECLKVVIQWEILKTKKKFIPTWICEIDL